MYSGDTAELVRTVDDLESLLSNLLILLSDKEKVVINKRFSLRGFDKHTLEQIGDEFSVTRERVRQIEKNALSKMRRNVFNTSLRYIHDFALAVVQDAGGFMREDKFMDELKKALPGDPNVDSDYLHLALVLHDDLVCMGNTILFEPFVREKNVKSYALKNASNAVFNHLSKFDEVQSFESVFRALGETLKESNINVVGLKSLSDLDKRLSIVDEDYVGLSEWRHVNPRTLKDKILFILKKEGAPLHFSVIANTIRDFSFDDRTVNLQAVHNELIRNDRFVLIGRGIYALSDWGYEKGTVTDVIESILKKKDEMSVDDIVSEVMKRRRVKKITVTLALKNSKKFERVGRRHYKLV